MDRREFLGGVVGAAGASAVNVKQPNIVIILADDFGYGSLNCYGGDQRLIRTPNMDRIAREGIRFTDGNTPSSVCTPSRYALLTGRYCWRTSLQADTLTPFAPLLIETTRPTVASMLRSKGYHTAAIGKWHLGYGTKKSIDYTAPLVPGPLQLGFDYHFAVPQNHGDAIGVYIENDSVYGLRSKTLEPFGRTHTGRQWIALDAPQRITDRENEVLTNHAVEWLGKQDAKAPFFLYFTPVCVHDPVTPSAGVRGSSIAGPYGDWIHDLDKCVGRILTALDQKGFTKDTLLILTSDNGGVLATEGDRPQAVAYKAGLRVNGDWRGGKLSIYQGGFRVPFMVRWPGLSPAGTVCDETINLVDMYGTIAAIVGAPLPPPEVAAEDTVNVLNAFLGKKSSASLRSSMISHSNEGIFAIRQGQWKYVEGKPSIPKFPAGRKGEAEPQLYNLHNDPAERNNLIHENPDVAARLLDLLSTSRGKKNTRRD